MTPDQYTAARDALAAAGGPSGVVTADHLARALAGVATLEREIGYADLERAAAAYTDLPPEPEPSALAAFLAVLATDNHPDNADGGGDCDGLR